LTAGFGDLGQAILSALGALLLKSLQQAIQREEAIHRLRPTIGRRDGDARRQVLQRRRRADFVDVLAQFTPDGELDLGCMSCRNFAG